MILIILITYHSPGVLGLLGVGFRVGFQALRPLVGRFDWSLLLRDGM